ncbi:ATPase, T2SS/T4P/T4SS family [Proteiniclasticum sp.]|uniref:type IV pilus twitching motility protein PilT n=1 Tax=Proteiniclasticum sp. TaxID=2053595 RepID=UPI00289BEC39|nr:ATPase, T2SS/T4P/T4SS family [Proteiniclasticum sp.]
MDRCIKSVLEESRRLGASDIVLKEDQKVMFRIHGELYESGFITSRSELEKFTSFLKPAEYVHEYLGSAQGIDVSFEYLGRYRVNCFSSMGMRCAVIRVISDRIKSLAELGLPEDLSDRVIRKRGLSLIVGRTGAGKSTTMAAVTDGILKKEKAHIITLEDPVEYKYSPHVGVVTQRELGKDFSGFDQGIQDALRQSPDYIVIGEIRTLNSLKAAVTAAEAGHGIIGTIHSLGAARTLTRMLSMFSEQEKEFVRYQLSSNLNFILSQKLDFRDNKAHLDYELMINVNAIENTIREGRFNQIDNLILLGEMQGMKRFNTR